MRIVDGTRGWMHPRAKILGRGGSSPSGSGGSIKSAPMRDTPIFTIVLGNSTPPDKTSVAKRRLTVRSYSKYVLLMRHTSSHREHGLNLRSELSQSQLLSSGILCQLLFVTVKLF